MLHFNSLPPSGVGRPDEDVYKVLVLDKDTKDVLAPLLHVNVSCCCKSARLPATAGGPWTLCVGAEAEGGVGWLRSH